MRGTYLDPVMVLNDSEITTLLRLIETHLLTCPLDPNAGAILDIYSKLLDVPSCTNPGCDHGY